MRKSYNLAGVLYSRPWSGRIGIKTSVRLPSVNFQNFYRGHFFGLGTIAGGTLGPGILSLEFPPKFQNPVNARLKDEFGARMVRVRGNAKVMCHLMFGVLALTVDQILRLIT